MFDIASDENYLMESLQNFKPPEQSVTDKSMSVFGDRQETKSTATVPKVIAGVKIQNMVENNADDLEEIREMQQTLAT